MKDHFGHPDASDILDMAHDAFFTLDHDWNFSYLNQRATILLNRPQEQLIGHSIWIEFPEAVHRSFHKHYYKAMCDKTVEEFEEYYPPPLDAWYEVRAVPYRHGLMVYFRNITKQKKSGQLRDQQYRSLFHEHPDAVFSFDLEGHFLSANPATAQLTGYSHQELLSMPFLPLIHESTLEHTLAHFKLAAQGVPQIYENAIVHKSGPLISCHVTNIPIVIDREIVGVYGIARNINEQKQAEYEIRDGQLRLHSLIQNNPDAIYTIDLDQRIVSCNPAAEQYLGYPKQELVRLPFGMLVLESEKPPVSSMMQEAFSGAASSNREAMIVHKDGSILCAHCTAVPIVVRGRTKGCYVILNDVTEQRKTERMLLQAEKLNIAGQLAAAIGHEIRNPLTALKGFIQLLSSSNHDDSRSYIFSILEEEVDRIEAITNELLVLAKPQSVEHVILDVSELLHSVVTLISSQANMQNVQLHLEVGPPVNVLGERNHLKQVFVNLLKNALEVMPEGGEVWLRMKQIGPREIRIEISDQGCGISEEQMAKLGEPFYSTKEKGTGLGLMVSKKIVETHGGRLEATSELGVGTTFSVYLPIEAS